MKSNFRRLAPVAAAVLSILAAAQVRGDFAAPAPPIPTAQAPNPALAFDKLFWLPRHLPGPTTPPTFPDSAARIAATMRGKLGKEPTFEEWRRLAALYEANNQYSQAAEAYRAEAAMYRKRGLTDAALIEENKASNLETRLDFYVRRQATQHELAAIYHGAPLEPIAGCYRGAFIDRDHQVGGAHFDELWQEHRSIASFEKLTGCKHASYFCYLSYGRPFPRQWVAECKKANALPHIAWEPKRLAMVQDDAYLRGWAAALRAADWPVFVRFAGEMNGFWTPYHGNPSLYREKFALVNRVLHSASPRVATIWCVNSLPLGNIADYYPGDANCDWVGINLYSVPYADNDIHRPTDKNSPLTLIDPIYAEFAARKPIAICEYGASHMSAVDHRRRTGLAINKMLELYTALPVLYPRIKLVDWFSMDTMRYTAPGRPQNDYELTEKPDVLAAYRAIQSDEYFLGAPEQLADLRPAMAYEMPGNVAASGLLRLTLWAKTYVPRPKIYLQWNGKIIYATCRPGANSVLLNLAGHYGRQVLTLFVYDDFNRFIGSKTTVVWSSGKGI